MRRFSFCLPVVLAFASAFIQAAEPAIGEVVATVNGQPILKSAVDRGLAGFDETTDEKSRERARKEIVDYLVDNALVDQYLERMKVTVEPKDIQERMGTIQKELDKSKQTLAKVLTQLKMTEADFVAHVTHDLRWEKFCVQQATDENLKKLFEQSPEMFDGTQVRARHILMTLDSEDEKVQTKAQTELLAIRQEVEKRVAEAVAKLPASADAQTREQEKAKRTEEAFADLSRQKSACPSKRDGGDLNWFPRFGSMVEPFAHAAFALKPFEMSQPVKTNFGVHLILATGRKAGQSVKFDDVKEEVREVYCHKLREAVIAAMKPQAKIVIHGGK